MSEVKKVADWELIERHYRAGVMSNIQIAAEFGLTEGAIRKRAKRDGWPKSKMASLVSRKTGKVALSSLDEMSSAGFVYVIYIDAGAERIFKIGMTKSFGARLETHQCASPFEVCVAACYFVGNMRKEERELHLAFGDKRVRGEWFRLDACDLRAIAERSVLI